MQDGGHLPAPLCSQLCFAGQKSTVHPPTSGGLPRAVPGSLPGTPAAARPGSAGFCRSGGTQVGHGHQHVALGTRQGVGRLPSRGAGRVERHTEKKLKPTLSLNKPPYSSKQIFL